MKNSPILLGIFASLLLCRCGALTPSAAQEINIEMFGIFKEPANPIENGNSHPNYYDFIFESITLHGTNELVLTPDSAETFKIIDRPQIVFTEDMSDYEEETYTGFTVVFDPTVTAGTTLKTHEIYLSTSTLTYSGDFSVEIGKGLRVLIKLLWQNTVYKDDTYATELIVEPDIQLEIEST